MPWQEAFDLLHDTQMLLRRAIDEIERAYEASTENINTNILLSLEFDEIFVSLIELVEVYTTHKRVNKNLLFKFQYFIFNTRKSIAIACAQRSEWLHNHYTFCKRIIYSTILLISSIEIETNRLYRRGEK